MKNKSTSSIGLIAQKAFSVAMAWYIFMSTAFPLALLNPVKAADETETTEAIETTVTPTATPEVTVVVTPTVEVTPTAEVTPTLSITPSLTVTPAPIAPLIVTLASSSSFIGSPKYVRAGNFTSDLVSQIQVPITASSVRFTLTGNDVAFTETVTDADITNNSYDNDIYTVAGAPSTYQWWRIQKNLSTGSYSIIAEYNIGGTWYPVSGSGTVYSLDVPWYTYTTPAISGLFFRPTDQFARVRVDDKYNQVSSISFQLYNATTNALVAGPFAVSRANCDLRSAGNYIECDLMRDYTGTLPILTEGTYYIRTQSSDPAGGGIRYVNTPSLTFTIDSTKPTLSDFAVDSPMVIYRSSITLSANAVDNNSVANVEFFVTAPRVSDGLCDGNGTRLTSATVAAPDTDGRYRATLNTSSLNGAFCVNAIAEDIANSHSSISKISVSFDNTAPAVPTGLHFDNTARTTSFACGAVTTRQPAIPDWNDIEGDSTFSHYEYTSFHPSGAIGLNEQIMATSEFVNNWMPPTDGAYGYAVRSVDSAGNKSAWALSGETLEGSCQIIYDSVAPVVAITSPTATLLSGTIAIRGSVTDANPHHYYLVIQKVGGSIVAGPGTVNDTTSFSDKFFFNWNTTTVLDGAYIIKLEARDAAGNKTGASIHWLTVTVDNTDPWLTLPDNIVEEAVSASGNIVNFTVTANDEVAGSLDVECTPASGSTFPIAVTTVNCTATDTAGNTATGGFTVTIEDKTKPTVPENVRFSNPAMACGAFTNVRTVTVDWDDSTDAVGVVGYDYYIEYPLIPTGRGTYNATTVASQRTGTLNPGLHQLKVRAKDAAGNKSDWTALCDITYDVTAPVVTVSDETFEADSPAGYNYTFNATATDNIDSELTVTCTPVDNSTAHQYPIGDTTITCSATDRAGNTGSADFIVTVVDTTDPTITDVEDRTLYEGDTMPAFSVTAEDIVGVKRICMRVTGPGMEPTPTYIEEEPTSELCYNVNPTSPSITLDVNSLFGLPPTVDLVNYFPMIQEGTYVFTYWAEDAAGNPSNEQETTIVVVNVPPTLTLTTAQNADRTFTYTAVGAGGNSPLSYTWTNGDFAGCSGTNQTVITPNLPRDYTCTVTVTDIDGDSVSRTATVTVDALPPVEPEVLGENTEEEEEVTPSVTPTPAVLGERVCSEKRALVVTVYLDKNGNGTRDNDEKAVESVKGEVYYTVENEKLTVGNFTSDNEGKWKLDVCSGDYTIKVDTASLPTNAKVAAETLGVSVLENQAETNIAITITEETDKKSIPYWIYILILLIAIGAIGYVVYKNRKE